MSKINKNKIRYILNELLDKIHDRNIGGIQIEETHITTLIENNNMICVRYRGLTKEEYLLLHEIVMKIFLPIDL
ncbi:MAG: hypothetical protein RSE41_09650 [Clostridia bacterium]